MTKIHQIKSNIFIFIIIFAGILIRILLIYGVRWSNNSDLNNYFWAGFQVTQGHSPYAVWAQNLGGPRADVLPLELALLSLVVAWGKSSLALRWLFLIADLVVLLVASWVLKDWPRRQLWWIILYALTPGPLYFFTLTPSDKPLILAGLLVLLGLSRKQWPGICPLMVVLVGLLAGFKWFGLFVAFPVAWSCGRRRIAHAIAILLSIGLIFGLAHLPWFPEWMVVYRFRQMRFGLPFHSGLAVLLQAAGLPMPILYMPLMSVSWLLIQILYWRGWISLPIAIVFSIPAILIWAPDTTAQMLFWLTLLMLLVVDWEDPVWIGLILLSTTWMTLMAAAAIGQVIPGLPLVDRLAVLSGLYGGPRLDLWSHLPLALLLIRILERRGHVDARTSV